MQLEAAAAVHRAVMLQNCTIVFDSEAAKQSCSWFILYKRSLEAGSSSCFWIDKIVF